VEPSREPLRILPWLAVALGLGIALGSRAAPGLFPGGFRAALAAAALAAALAHAWRAAPRWVPWALALAFFRASAEVPPAPGASPWTSATVAAARAQPIVGRWRAEGDGRTGWIEPFPGEPAGAGHALLLEPAAWIPPEGTPVAALPGGEVTPWPRGPTPAPGSRARRFAAQSALAADELVLLGAPPPEPLAPLARALERWRALLGQRVAALEGETSAGLLRALLTGERAGLAPERSDLFARTGTSHLLAISGWNVGLFAALVLWPLARLAGRTRRARAASFALRALLLLLFASLAGGEKPVLRASLALVLASCAALIRGAPRRPDGLSFLAAGFALECLLDPAGIGSLSLSLSYAATAGLLVGTGPLLAGLRGPSAEPLRARGWARVIARRAARAFATALAASCAAVLATLPIAWSVFGEVAPAGALLTLLVLPPFTALCLIAWLGALVPAPLWRGPAELCARVLYALLELGDALPGTPLALPARPAWVVAGATLLVFLALHRPRARRWAALAWGIVLLPWSAAPRGLELHALDVGHGTAVLLRAPGLEALVYDCGSRDRRRVQPEAVAPLFARWEVARPVIVLSHPDRDHASALERLAARTPPRSVWGAAWEEAGAGPGSGAAQGAVRQAHGVPRLDLTAGRLRLPSAAPELGLSLIRGRLGAGNEGSRALLVAWRGERLLLLGDAEEEGLEGLELAQGPLRLLLAPHHGSDAPGLGPLLERTPPLEVWVSASEPPAIGPELERRGIPWRWTGAEGPLALRLP